MRKERSPETTDGPARRGRPFEKGNSGRKRGSQNRTTRVAAALLQGEEGELVRTAVDLAKSGDVVMLKFLLSRILPSARSVRVELPPTDGDFDPVGAMETILNAAVSGQILPSEAAALASTVTAYARTLDVAELKVRLQSLEKRLGDTP
jgi:hypothetical protein